MSFALTLRVAIPNSAVLTKAQAGAGFPWNRRPIPVIRSGPSEAVPIIREGESHVA